MAPTRIDGAILDSLTTWQKLDLKSKGLEIVFVSSDRDQSSFENYFAEMPWLSLPYPPANKDAINLKYGVQGIPCLVILNSDGSIATKEGRKMVLADPKGERFPWAGSSGEEPQTKPPTVLGVGKENLRVLYTIPGVLELFCAASNVTTVCSSAAFAMQWLLLDGILSIVEVLFGLFQVKKVLEAQADPELKAYLSRKRREHITDPRLDAKAKLLKPDPLNPTNNPLNPILRWSNLAMLAVGVYLAFMSKLQDDCEERPLRLLKYLVIFKIAFPCLSFCAEPAATYVGKKLKAL